MDVSVGLAGKPAPKDGLLTNDFNKSFEVWNRFNLNSGLQISAFA